MVLLQKEVKKVYMYKNGQDILIRQPIKDVYIDFLLVGGGGGGSQYYGGGGGAGGVIQCSDYFLEKGEYSITIGAGGSGIGTCCDGNNGGNSTALGLTAYGGGGGGGYSNRPGHNGGSGGGAGYLYSVGGTGCTGQGHNGAVSVCSYSSGGGGGAGTNGCTGTIACMGGYGGRGIQSDIDGTCKWYASGGTGHNGYNCLSYNVAQSRCTALNGARAESNANICGGGGGGTPNNASYGKGACGIFILRYPTNCGYCLSGGNCTYTCGDYTIHCFTSDGTLTVN